MSCVFVCVCEKGARPVLWYEDSANKSWWLVVVDGWVELELELERDDLDHDNRRADEITTWYGCSNWGSGEVNQ